MTRKKSLPTNATALSTSTAPAVAVIGSGYWGKNLVRNYHSLNALKLVCDKDESILENIKEQYSGIETCIAFTEITTRDDIQELSFLRLRKRTTILPWKHYYRENMFMWKSRLL